MPELTVKKGDQKILGFSLTDDIITIGRAEENDLWLPDKDKVISRYHAALVRLPGKEDYFIRDLGSFLSTKVGGKIVYRKLLEDGDTICIGNYTLEYRKEGKPRRDDIFEIISDRVEDEIYVDGEGGTTVFYGLDDFVSKLPAEKARILVDVLRQIEVSHSFSREVLQNILDPILGALQLGRITVIVVDKNKPELYASRGTIKGGMKLPIPKSWPGAAKIEEHHGRQVLFVPSRTTGDEDVSYFMCFEKETSKDRFIEDDIRFSGYVANILCKKIASRKKTEEVLSEEIFDWPDQLIGNSKSMRAIREEVRKISSSDINVLILGETGTGKGEVAEAIWKDSPRRDKRFERIDCTTIPEDLVESELFGRKRGAYTEAKTQKEGLVELAKNGTIFLDEIGDLSPSFQEKLRTFIDTKEFRRVGGLEDMKADVRLVSATNRNLPELVEKGEFRADLYYRLGGYKISIPPLKERREDIPLLAHFFLDKFAKKKSRNILGISHETMNLLWEHYDWPGNMRELRDCIEAVVDRMPEDRTIVFPHDIPQDITAKLDYAETPENKPERGRKFELKSLREMEKEYIEWILKETKWNKTEAAKILKISRPTLDKRIRDYEIPSEGV